MARLLLIGNSRWHWAEASDGALRCWHTAPAQALDLAPEQPLRAWAAVGPLPVPAPGPEARQARDQLNQAKDFRTGRILGHGFQCQLFGRAGKQGHDKALV